jgi:hypothetical protein
VPAPAPGLRVQLGFAGGTAEAGRSAASIRPTRRRLPPRARRPSCFRNSSCRAGAPQLVLGSRSLRLCCGSLTHGASILGRFGHHMHLPLAVGSIAHDITLSVDVHPYILACVTPASPLLERWRHIRDTLFFRAQMPWKDFHAFVLAHLPVCGAPCRPGPLGAVRLEVCARDTDAHKRQRPVRALGRCSQRPRNMTSPLFAKQATQGWATTMPCEPCFSLAHLSTHQRSRAQLSHR